MPVSSPYLTAKVDPPGTITTGLSRRPARAIIMAGNPLSQEAIPIMPLAVGRDLARRLNTCAESFLYGKESSMPFVPWVRQSQGSEQYKEKGMVPSWRNSLEAISTIWASSK